MSKLNQKLKRIGYSILPKQTYISILYRKWFGRWPNLRNPERFTEKLFCLKVINEREFGATIKQCYDKLNVRDYVVDKLGEEDAKNLLNELYDVYDNVDDIEFDALPTKFVLKITQSSGGNIICPDKSALDIDEAKKKLKIWLERARSGENKNTVAYEEAYVFDGHPRIICEKFLEDSNGKIPSDIRVFCFNGEPKLFVIDFGTTEESGEHGTHIVRNVYDLDWNLMDVNLGRPHDSNYVMEKPSNLDEIISISRKLSQDFYFVRVDLYNIDGALKFGELTWLPMGGRSVVTPDEYDFTFGSWLKIPSL